MSAGPLRRLRARLVGRAALDAMVLAVTAGCDSACAGCSFRAAAPDELDAAAWVALGRQAAGLGAREVLVTGGEPLLRDDLAEILAGLRAAGLKVGLHTNGLRLARRAREVAAGCDHLYVSLDGWDAASYRSTRGVDGLRRLGDGLEAVRGLAPGLPITSRTRVTRHHVGHLGEQVRVARAMGAWHVSLLAVDLASPSAFGREGPAADEDLIPTASQVGALRDELEALPGLYPGLLVDSPAALRRIWRLYAAHHGMLASEPPRCRAPWTSAVIDARGGLRPCFFLPQRMDARAGLAAALDDPRLRTLRRTLRQRDEPACQRCVCWR